MVTLSLVMPFYRNPGMLAEQYRVWASYPPELKGCIEIVLVDDGSPGKLSAIGVARPEGMPSLRIFRVNVDIPWHQHGARNLGALMAVGRWLLLTDMDHVLPEMSLIMLLERLECSSCADIFTFQRLDAPDLKPTRNDRGELKPHVNSFAVMKTRFWQVGGYDEDCVGYGTDSYFRKRLFAAQPGIHLADVPLIRYPRELIPDASTSEAGVDPRALRNAGRRSHEVLARLEQKKRNNEGPRLFSFPWEQVF